jgi:iron complex outermembrane recepter protein
VLRLIAWKIITVFLRFNADWMTADINLFHNWVNDYIYQNQDYRVFNEDLDDFEAFCSGPAGACLPVLQSAQANAIFSAVLRPRRYFP